MCRSNTLERDEDKKLSLGVISTMVLFRLYLHFCSLIIVRIFWSTCSHAILYLCCSPLLCNMLVLILLIVHRHVLLTTMTFVACGWVVYMCVFIIDWLRYATVKNNPKITMTWGTKIYFLFKWNSHWRSIAVPLNVSPYSRIQCEGGTPIKDWTNLVVEGKTRW